MVSLQYHFGANIENAIREIRMAFKKYEAAPEDERDYSIIRVAVGEPEKLVRTV